jgi:hypothetical protein
MRTLNSLSDDRSSASGVSPDPVASVGLADRTAEVAAADGT